MKTKSNLLKSFLRLSFLLLAFLALSQEASAWHYNRGNTKRVIQKTAYIIDEAYEIADYYNYWQGEYLSRAVYYNDYAYRLMKRRDYRASVHFSLKAREYALRVIDECEDYWEYYYYENYGWSHSHGNNPYYNPNNNNYNNNYYGNYNNYYSKNNGTDRNGVRSQYNPNNTNNNNTQTGHLNNNNSSSNRGDSRYKNLKSEQYYDQDELGLISSLPNDENLEQTFKRDNSNIRFDDKSIKNDRTVINRNRDNAESYSNRTNSNERTKIQFSSPQRVDPRQDVKDKGEGRPQRRTTTTTREDGYRSTTPIKTVQPRETTRPRENNQTRTTERTTKPAKKEVKQEAKESKPAKKEAKESKESKDDSRSSRSNGRTR